MRKLILSALLAIGFASTASGAVFIVPSDEQLISNADGIVVAHATVRRGVRMAERDVNTITSFRVERVLKGTIDHRRPLDVMDLGGVAGEYAMGVSGGVSYRPGERVLLFLQQNGGGWTTYGMSLGKFNFAASPEGEELLVRWFGEGHVLTYDEAMNPHQDSPRHAAAFLARIAQATRRNIVAPCDPNFGPCPPDAPGRGTQRDVGPGSAPWASHDAGSGSAPWASHDAAAPATTGDEPSMATGTNAVSADASAYPPSAFTQGTFRWDRFDKGQSVTFFVSGRQPGYDDLGAAQRALAAWTNDPNSNVSYLYGGTTTAGFAGDGRNTIVYNASTGVPSGAIGYARWYAGGSHTYKGEMFYTTTEGDVIMRSGLSVSQAVFDEAVAHEVGHTLGFRHSDQGTPSSTNAVMNSVVYGRLGARLAAWDVEAVSTVYTATATVAPPCTPPSITAQPASTSVTSGSTATLSVTASGTAPISYQWYVGSSGTITTPISGATSSTLTVTPSATTTYWVRVSNACGSVNSTSATITVVAAAPRSWTPGDMNGDGYADLLWRHYGTGANTVWLMSGTSYLGGSPLPAITSPQWKLGAAADFNGDQHTDLVWHQSETGATVIWLMQRTTRASNVTLRSMAKPWTLAGSGDLTGDGEPDLVWRNATTGANILWVMNGASIASTLTLPAMTGTAWRIEAAADMNGDSRADLVWRNYTTGATSVWFMNGATRTSTGNLSATLTDTNWRIEAAADYDRDGDADLVWRNYATGANVIWMMQGTTRQSSVTMRSLAVSPWELSGPR